jgi:hypothetical protein
MKGRSDSIASQKMFLLLLGNVSDMLLYDLFPNFVFEMVRFNNFLIGSYLQLLILWDKNDYYGGFNLPFAVSILIKILQVLIASVSHSGLVYVFFLYFVGRPRNESMGYAEHF